MDSYGKSALILAVLDVRPGTIEIVTNLLEHGADVNITTLYPEWQAIDYIFDYLTFALEYNLTTSKPFEVIAKLLEHGAVIKGDNLIFAVDRGSLELVEFVLEYQIDVNYATDLSKRTALMAAAEGNLETVIETLVEHGAVVDQQDDRGRTALFKAVASGSSKAVLALLQHNASATIKDEYHYTPLMIAVIWGRAEVVQILLSNVDFSSQEKSRALGIS